jgi:hypothetical protein
MFISDILQKTGLCTAFVYLDKKAFLLYSKEERKSATMEVVPVRVDSKKKWSCYENNCSE